MWEWGMRTERQPKKQEENSNYKMAKTTLFWSCGYKEVPLKQYLPRRVQYSWTFQFYEKEIILRKLMVEFFQTVLLPL